MKPSIFLTLMIGICQAAVINLNNQGFESGTTSGWTTAGLVAAATGPATIGSWTVGPAGSFMGALLSGGICEGDVCLDGIPVTSLETFLGVTPGLLAGGLPPGTPGAGSAIYQDFVGSAGDTVTMYWAYVAYDQTPANNPAFAVVTGPGVEQLTILASISTGGVTVGDYGATGWHAFTYVLPVAGTFRLGFGVASAPFSSGPAFLYLDDQPGTGNFVSSQIPEPSSFALLGAGLLGVLLLRRR
ncbi:MAG: PEP-CTERM sorting domain-containing protein [Bryobacteraceae bacterium]